MITPFFGKAVAEHESYLKIAYVPKPIKMPVIQGIKRKKMTNQGAHLNPFLQERDMELFDIHDAPQKDKRKTVMVKPVVESVGVPFNQSYDYFEDPVIEEEQEEQDGDDFIIHG